MASTHRMTLLALLLAGMGAAGSALAGLGPIHVLSSEGQPFEAEIPVVDEDPQGNVLVGLADRNKYPLVSTYSQSAPVLKFSAIRKPDGSIQKILVKGPSHFDEPLLRFAVEMSWPAGRLVREFEVDYLRDGPPRKDKQPAHDDTVKKSVVAPDQMPRLGSLGLGQLKVNSKLGEPLVAELELFGTAARQTDNIHVALTADSLQGNPSAEQSQLIASISHQLTRVADKSVLQLRSTRPLNEPVLSFRLDVGAANVHAQKRYTLLLDPNGYTVEEHAVTPAPDRKLAAAQVQPLKVYRVRHGDTLSRIASRMKGGGSAVETAGRLYEGNPDAFIGGDVNRLRAGTALKYPAAWHLAAVPASHPLKQAGGEEKPLGKPVVAAAPAAPIAAPAAAAHAATPHEAPAKPVVQPEAVSLKPMVKVPAATAKPAASAPAASAPQVSAVKGVSPGASANDQEARLKNILQRQDQVLLQAQQKAQELEQKIRIMQLAKAAEASAAAIAAQNKPVASQAAAEPAVSHAVASAPQPVTAAQPHAEASKAVSPVKPQVSKAPEAEKPASFLVDDVLAVLHDNTVALAGGAAVIGLSGLLLAQRRRRNKQEDAQPAAEPLPAADNPSMLTMGPLTTLMSGIKRGEGIDLASVDLIAEAEVYLAYGRLDQALDILREGLVREPLRQDLRYKLLEVLAMMPDKDGFIAEATTARGIFGKDSTLWMRVCELGRTLAPEHPLFETHPVVVASPIDLQPVRLTPASAEHAPASEVAADGGIDLATELGAVEAAPEPVLDTEFLEKPPAGPAPLPPAAEHNDTLSGLDAFASLGEQELENAVKQAPEPMLDMDFLADLPETPVTEAPVSKPTPPASTPSAQSEANDKMELAKLYLEMGDKETAEALMKEAGQTV